MPISGHLHLAYSGLLFEYWVRFQRQWSLAHSSTIRAFCGKKLVMMLALAWCTTIARWAGLIRLRNWKIFDFFSFRELTKCFCFFFFRYMLYLALSAKLCSSIFFFGAWWSYIPPKHIQQSADDELTVDLNGAREQEIVVCNNNRSNY